MLHVTLVTANYLFLVPSLLLPSKPASGWTLVMTVDFDLAFNLPELVLTRVQTPGNSNKCQDHQKLGVSLLSRSSDPLYISTYYYLSENVNI
jgi:hypothetical protein